MVPRTALFIFLLFVITFAVPISQVHAVGFAYFGGLIVAQYSNPFLGITLFKVEGGPLQPDYIVGQAGTMGSNCLTGSYILGWGAKASYGIVNIFALCAKK